MCMQACAGLQKGVMLLPVQDSEELLRNLHLAPYAKPIVSLVDDFPMVQKHKGWQFGFMSDNTTRRMTCDFPAPRPVQQCVE